MCGMPLLQPDSDITLSARGSSVNGKVFLETSNRIFVGLENESPPGPFRSEGSVSAELLQGAFRCTFQSRIVYSDRDQHTGRYMVIVDYPAAFRRERQS